MIKNPTNAPLNIIGDPEKPLPVYWIAISRSVNKTASSESALFRASHLIPLALGFILTFMPHLIGLNRHYYIEDNSFIEISGTVLTLIGLLFAVWGRRHLGKYWSGIITLKEGHMLIRTGPYRLVRHPLYTGFLGGALGSAVTAHTYEAAFGFWLILIAYIVKIHREERLLTQKFGDEYLSFKREVKTLIPFIF